jgi:hypothetical protein
MGREPDSPARKGARVARRCRRSPPPGMRSSGTRSCTRSRRAVEASHSLHRVEREGSRQPLVYEHLWTPHMVTGKTLDEVGHRFEGDVLGSDPQAAWGHATAGAEDALRAPGALEGRVHTSIGRIPTREYAMQLFGDVVVHGGIWPAASAPTSDWIPSSSRRRMASTSPTSSSCASPGCSAGTSIRPLLPTPKPSFSRCSAEGHSGIKVTPPTL